MKYCYLHEHIHVHHHRHFKQSLRLFHYTSKFVTLELHNFWVRHTEFKFTGLAEQTSL